MKIIQLLFMLIMILHWIACLWYYVINLSNVWIPPKDQFDGNTVLYTEKDWGNQYLDVFYYALVALVGNEMFPTNSLEIGVVSIIIFTGSIIIGTIIGEFSSILGELSIKAK